MPTVPRGLQQIVDKAAKHVDGKYCWGLPHYSSDTKLRFHLVELGDMDLFDENEVDVEELPEWMPFAALGEESQFLAVSSLPPYPVGMWEHEDGKIHAVWESIDDFLGKVIDKHDSTPVEMFEAALDAASKLVDADAYTDALRLLEPAMARMPAGDDDDQGRAYNLLGLSLKGTGRFAEARIAFDKASALGEDYAELNILSLLSDELPDPRALIERATKARDDRYFDVYGQVWLARYLAGAYLDLGQPDNAEAELRGLVDKFAISNAGKIDEARAGLEDYIAKGRPGAAAARGFLDWFHRKTYDVTPAQAATNRAWWDGLPAKMRAKLLEEIDREGADPVSDDDIARSQDADSLYLDDDSPISDIAMFLPLRRVETLSFHGDIDSVEALRALPKLTSLKINREVIKDFALQPRADRQLLAAAEEADRKGIEAALAAGASIHARDHHGHTALNLVAGKHDIALACWLVERGADPWAQSHHDMDAFDMFSSDDKETLERTAAKAGIAPPGREPWAVLTIDNEAHAATFDDPEDKLELSLDDGDPLAASWPADVRFVMEAPKRDNKLFDIHRIGYRGMAVSARVAEIVGSVPNVELLPITLLDHDRKVRPEKFWLLNPLAIDCLIDARCHPKYNLINDEAISEVGAIVIDPERVGGAKMFRLGRLTSHPVIVSRDLAARLAGIPGIKLSPPKR